MSTAADDIWVILRELARSQKETERSFKETDLKFKETDLKFKETDKKFQDTERMFRETGKKLNQLESLFVSQWGKLMESLVEGDLVRLLTERGIAIADTSSRLKGKNADGGNYEFDIVAHDGDTIVVVEVKTTLKPQDVEDFLAKLGQIKRWIPRYADNRIHGAVAWLTADAGAERMAENKGLFSVRATGDSASIQNAPNFVPRAW